MTDNEKIATVKAMYSEADDATIRAYLSLAADKILKRLYPFQQGGELPKEFDMTQCELSVRLLARRGGEGEISHAENGINRTYGTVDDEDILSRITPYCKVVR